MPRKKGNQKNKNTNTQNTNDKSNQSKQSKPNTNTKKETVNSTAVSQDRPKKQPIPPTFTQKKDTPPNLKTKQPVKAPVEEQTGGMLDTLPKKLKLEIAPKPQRVPVGQLRKCTVNHFQISIGAENVFQYHINFDPDLENPRARRKLIDDFRKSIGSQYVYDGDSLLFSAIHFANLTAEKNYNGRTYSVQIRHVKTNNTTSMSPQVYSVFCKRILQFLKLTPLGRQYYDISQAIHIKQHHIELWPGFFTSIGSTMKGATLCADIAHKILRTDTVLDMIHNEKKKNNNYKATLSKLLEGQIVLTRYNNRTYRVDSVDWKSSPLSKFEIKGQSTSFVQFYGSVHNLKITDLQQPLLVIYNRRTKVSINLIPEFCCLTGLSDQMRADFKVMQDLDKHTKTEPTERYRRLVAFSKSINQSKNVQEGFSEWKVKLNEAPLKVEGRLLSSESVQVGKQMINAGPKAQWNNRTIVAPVSISGCLFIYPNQVTNEANELLKQIKTYANQFGIPFANPNIKKISSDTPDNYTSVINACYSDKIDLVVCLLQRKGHSYDAIKVLCCNQLGVPSQCVLAKSMKNPKRVKSISSKIVQQMDCKVGAELWRVNIPLKQTMIVGIDVCHDTHSDKGRGKRSVVGFCATTNNTYTKYFSTVKFQGVGQEIVDQLSECFTEALTNWNSINNSYPDRVIVYRDGVGEGQFLEVLEYEVPQISQILRKKNPNARLSVTIVQKRIHTRIFDHTVNINSPTNAPPGTIIDNGCVSKDTYDFYMVSQFVLTGTATPTHYRVVKDEIGLRQDIMQQLTYKLCHLYYNWAGTIRVPAPCHYAHKIAFLIGQSVHAKPHSNLDNLLHFL